MSGPGPIPLLMTCVLLSAICCQADGNGGGYTLESARAAAQQGDVRAEYFLGKSYARGEGVTKDYAKAVEFLRRSAEQGYAYAQNDLAALYGRGWGVSQDYAQALKW